MYMQLIKIYKDNCVPCDQLTRLLSYYGVSYTSVNLFDKGMMGKYKARSVPTLIMLDDEGNEISRVEGYKPTQIIKFVEDFIK